MKKHNLLTSALLSTALLVPAAAMAATNAPAATMNKADMTTQANMAHKPTAVRARAGVKGRVNHGRITPASKRQTSAPVTLQKKVRGPNGQLLATQPGEVEINADQQQAPDATQQTQKQAIAQVQASEAPTQQAHARRQVDNTPTMTGEVNRGNITPAQLRAQPAPITLQKKIKGRDGELLATQPGEVQLNENRRYSAAQ